MLNEQDRKKLDGIVQQMTANGESDADIQFVVNDFKQKYGGSSLDSVMKPVEPEKKSVGGFMSNLGKSALNFGSGLATAVMNPIDTVKTVGSLALGAGDNLLEMGGLSDGNNRFNKMADMVGDEYKNRYGGWQNIKDTAYSDPVGVLADLATVLSGGAGVATKAGKVAQIGSQASKLSTVGKVGEAGKIAQAGNFGTKAGSFLQKASTAVDPLNYALKGGSKVASFAAKKGATPVNVALKGIGLSTGRGGDTFRQIWDASKAGRTGAVTAMRGGMDDNKIISSLDKADATLRQMAREEWNKLGLDSAKKSLDISPVFKALDEGLADLNVKRTADGGLDFSRARGSIRFDKNAQSRVQTIVDEMDGYGTTAGDRLPSAVDDLKQSFASLYDDTSEVKGFVEKMRKSTRTTLSQVDGYDDYTKNYGEIMDLLDEMKRELSSKNKNPSQTWRKLTNTFKQKNTESRQRIVKRLQDEGISDIADEIAGYTAKDLFPSDIVRGGIGLYSAPVIGTINPLLLPTLSPRVMGEVVNFIGKNTGRAERMGAFLKEATKNGTQKVPASKIIQYIGGQVYNKNKATRSSTLQQRLLENAVPISAEDEAPEGSRVERINGQLYYFED